MPEIFNDGPGRIVLVAFEEQESGVDPFAAGTRLGDTFAELLGAPVSTWFASVAMLPLLETRYRMRQAYGWEMCDALAERRVIAIGRETAALLHVPAEPMMIWQHVRWRYVGETQRVLPAVTSAAFPTPGARSAWWRDTENVEVARQWLEEQRGGTAT